MAEVVLVHGIAQEQRGPHSLLSEWRPELASGVELGGFPDVAGGLVSGEVSVEMAFYGHLFLKAGAQGSGDVVEVLGDLDDDERLLVEALALEWVERAATRSEDPETVEAGRLERQILNDEAGQPQGPREWARKITNSLSSLPPFARLGYHVAEKFVARSLRQVTSYLTDPDVRSQAIGQVHRHIDSDTRVLIGHSLGSVVAYEALRDPGLTGLRRDPIELLVTLGSPLGLDTIIYPRLQPQPPQFPAGTVRWVNAADPDDIVAAEPDLSTMFPNTGSGGGKVVSLEVDNGAAPHSAQHYLTKAVVGREVGTALRLGD